ncbi:uncharacterized protein LOC124256122 [Haliotis rubra]|uniref:uncharacterized protein LOC124256122 n=1 Tax=Haliotis rubra TaxID=36100 RepID=UPI001EE532D6|nr:uncharacterized protein LOC124256122 [Haliotis rubra]
MVTDFEAVTWRGFQRVFPAVQIKGCPFHMNQAIYRKVQNLGLATAYEEDVGTHRFVKKLMGLQFLDAAHIRPAFIKVKQQTVTPDLVALCDYYEATWIRSTVWTVANWSVFGTADLESWHKRLNQLSGRRHLPFYRLLPLLFREADLLPLQIRLVADGQLDRRQHAGQRAKSDKFFRLWDEFQAANLTVSQLLRVVSKLNGPMVTE